MPFSQDGMPKQSNLTTSWLLTFETKRVFSYNYSGWCSRFVSDSLMRYAFIFCLTSWSLYQEAQIDFQRLPLSQLLMPWISMHGRVCIYRTTLWADSLSNEPIEIRLMLIYTLEPLTFCFALLLFNMVSYCVYRQSTEIKWMVRGYYLYVPPNFFWRHSASSFDRQTCGWDDSATPPPRSNCCWVRCHLLYELSIVRIRNCTAFRLGRRQIGLFQDSVSSVQNIPVCWLFCWYWSAMLWDYSPHQVKSICFMRLNP